MSQEQPKKRGRPSNAELAARAEVKPSFVEPQEVAPVIEDDGATREHVYPDGSSVFGCPPFPKLSPLQRAAEAARAQASAEATNGVIRADHLPSTRSEA